MSILFLSQLIITTNIVIKFNEVYLHFHICIKQTTTPIYMYIKKDQILPVSETWICCAYLEVTVINYVS
jgi:hypothetical protein